MNWVPQLSYIPQLTSISQKYSSSCPFTHTVCQPLISCLWSTYYVSSTMFGLRIQKWIRNSLGLPGHHTQHVHRPSHSSMTSGVPRGNIWPWEGSLRGGLLRKGVPELSLQGQIGIIQAEMREWLRPMKGIKVRDSLGIHWPTENIMWLDRSTGRGRVRNKIKLADLGHVCHAKDLCPRPLSLSAKLWLPLLTVPLFALILFYKVPANTELVNHCSQGNYKLPFL